ncbi:hypothetical protein CEXT_46831 [Caerostris extrusa]|uniref:Uncharacterized protein n=1 Tax=Caerostris extrusa TaxID=172846 RepID=A0AAV4X4C3_CAEEX|nr:hypothetical protein CEXT_46831 [Caerostris extrusa]
MWSGLGQQLLDDRQTPEATRNSNSCFAAFSLSAGNRRGVYHRLGSLFHSQQIIASAQLVRLSYGQSVKQQIHQLQC